MTTTLVREKVESWLEVLDDTNHYELLGLLEIADDEAIQEGFHQFAEAFHPDRHRAEPSDVRSGVTRIFRRGAEAYRILRDPALRSAYDLTLAKARAPAEMLGAAPERARSLDELCLTAGGRLHARQAERAITAGRLQEALGLLRKAALAEGKNPELKERLESLQVAASLGGEG